MKHLTQAFKLQAVEKALSRRPGQTIESTADKLGIACSTLHKWIRLAKDNRLERPESAMPEEKSPQDWDKLQRFEALMHCHNMTDEEKSTYCREQGIYPYRAIACHFVINLS